MRTKLPDKRKILLVDDEEIIRFNISRILSGEKDYEITMADSGEEAINYLRSHDFELVLTDLVMEGIDGIGVLEEVKRISAHTVVIIITGYGSLGSAVKAMQRGAYDYIMKPCEPEELIMRVKRGMDKYDLEKRILEVNKLEAILSNIGIYTLDSQGYITNDNMVLSAKLWGKSSLIGTNIFDLKPIKEMGLEECFSEALKGVSSELDDIIYYPAGSNNERLLSSHIVSTLYPNGKVMSISWILEDNTKRINVLQQIGEAEKLAALGKLAAGVAHEINNPLNTINLDLEFFKKKISPDDSLMENILSISRETERIAQIVKQLHDHVREDEGRVHDVDLSELLTNSIFSILFYQVAEEGKPVTVQLEDNLPPVIISPNKLSQVLMNLIKNAAESIEGDGEINLTAKQVTYLLQDLPSGMSLENSEKNDLVFIEIKIADTGRGIKDKELSHLFEPFFTTKGVQGTGLGLFISYCIVKSYGGWIIVKSRVGEGTEFTINLPARCC
ncbi:MAG: response regulator [bacterium]